MLTATHYVEINLLSTAGLSSREISRVTGRNRSTIRKVLCLKTPPPPAPRVRKKKMDSFRALAERRLTEGGITCDRLLLVLRHSGYHGSLSALKRFVRAFREKRLKRRAMTATLPCGASLLADDHFWMLRLMQGEIDAVTLRTDCGLKLTLEEAQLLIGKIVSGRLGFRNRAVVVAAHLRGIPARSMAPFLRLNRQTVRRYCKRAPTDGLKEFFDLSRKGIKKADDQLYRDAVFKILHAPPLSLGFNRTTWKMCDIRSVLKAQGLPISAANVRLIIRNAGFRFRKARKVLTSNDPEYRRKLEGITAILQRLKPDEKFFSIDEFGPFAVKIQGGRSLVRAGEIKTVPQRQRSKGRLICTAALELSENQVTHFYSEKKNTGEMLKLLDTLLTTYSNQACIYFSWDAASWHASKKLFRRVDEINSAVYRSAHPGPRVVLAPLPACAQFLNVIESVFSGMARAVVHNSDYSSTAACMEAIDRHFAERNQHFRAHPRRAGNKLWGKERVPPTFDEAHNCKDPRW
jgi:transposase